MKNKFFKFSSGFFVILIIFLIHLFSNIFWIKINPRITGEDVPSHLFNSLTIIYQLNQAISEHDIFSMFYQLNSGAINNNQVHNYEWPRLVYFISAIFNLILGTSLFVTIMSNMFWFLILMASVYLIGSYFADEETGLFATFLTSFSPFIWGMSRKYGLDFPLIAITSLSIYFLLRTEGFKNRLFTMLFFSALGIGFNVKMQILIFLIAPIFINIFGEKCWKSMMERAKNMILGVTIFFIISSIFWLGSLKAILDLFFIQQTVGFNDSALVHKTALVPCLLFYSSYLLRGLGFVLILSIVGVYKLLKAPQKSKLLILSWAIIPIVIFSVMSPKHERYILPVFPAFCLIASSGIIHLKNKILKHSLVSLCLTMYVYAFFIITFGLMNYYDLEHRIRFIGFYGAIHQPGSYNLDAVGKKFAAVIQKYNKDKSCKIGILEHTPSFIVDDPLILLYYIRLEMPDRFFSMKKNALISTELPIKNFIQLLPSVNFLIISTKSKDDTIDYKNILSSNFNRPEVLNQKDQILVKKYLSDFEVISKEEVRMEHKNFILNLLVHK